MVKVPLQFYISLSVVLGSSTQVSFGALLQYQEQHIGKSPFQESKMWSWGLEKDHHGARQQIKPKHKIVITKTQIHLNKQRQEPPIIN